MAPKTKQDVLRFPVQKTRSSSKSIKQQLDRSPFNSEAKTSSLSRKKGDGLSGGNVTEERRLSPRKKILEYNVHDEENVSSPTKKSCTRNLSSNKNEISSMNGVVSVVQLKRTPLKNVVYNSCGKSPNKFIETISSSVSSPCKLPKPSDLGSPVRRSSRKLEFENSPSKLVSQLNVSSPKSPRTIIGLHRAELRAYQSLKTSFARNCNNRIVGRETEISFLEEFLHSHLKNKTAGSLYVSGAPGTGKTASVMKIVDDLNVVPFKKVILNCMSKKSSKEIFTSIAEGLKLHVSHTEREIISQIEKALTSSKFPVIIILDEVDQLESKNQRILYTLFEWPSLARSKLVLIGIANMLDLTDRVLPRLQANHSCRPQLLHFPPYNKREIVQILNERVIEADIGDMQVLKPSAVHFLAGKVSAVAGDVRKALDVCRRAVELCEIQVRNQMRLVPTKSPSKSPRKHSNSVLKQVDIPQILIIFNEVYGSRVTTEITENPNTFPLQQKILICTLLLILKHSKTKNVSLGKFHEVYSRVCLRQKLTSVEQSEFFSLCTLLESRGMLQVKKTKELRNSKILLRLNEEEAEMALGDKALLATVLEDKGSLGKANNKRI